MASQTTRSSGLGAARDGTHHWWAQRLTSIALVPLAVAFVPVFASVAGGDLDAAREAYTHPFHAIAAILFLAATFYHLSQGVQVVIEDYIHHAGWKTALLVANTLGCILLGAAGVFAVARIALLQS